MIIDLRRKEKHIASLKKFISQQSLSQGSLSRDASIDKFEKRVIFDESKLGS